MGNQTHGVMGHRRGDPSQHPFGEFWLKRFKADSIQTRGIERRHINPWHHGQIKQQSRARQPCLLAFGQHQSDLRQQLLTITQGDEIEKGGIRLWIAGGRWPSSKDQRRSLRVTQRQVTAVCRSDRNPAEIQHLQDVGGAQLITQAEAKDVEGVEGPAALHTEQRLLTLLEAFGEIGGRQVGAITDLPRQGIENRVENDVPQIAGAHLIKLGIGEGPANPGGMPVPGLHTQLMAHIASGPVDARIHQLVKRHRRGGWIQRDGHGLPTRLPSSYVAGCPQKSVFLWSRSTAITSNSRRAICSLKSDVG